MGCGSSTAKSSAPVSTTPVELPSKASLVELLGSTLRSGSGEVDTAEALSGKAAVAFYFSAHWCPPCKGFTPQLAQWYTKNLKAKGLEVVFVSSDQDEASFNGYFKEMPWLALPFSERGRKDALSKRFKVQGIPSLVVLDADGTVITKDGREAVTNDCTGQEFPWKPKSFKEVMTGATLIGQGCAQLNVEALEGKTLALYFSAHWCPPCRGFTPQFVKWYTDNLKAKGLEVIFVSSDRDENSFKEYFKEMPWLALNYSDQKRKQQLSTMFGVSGIPALVIVGSDGSTITKEGRGIVSSDPEGADFPWYPKAVVDLKSGPGSLNEVPTVIAFCEGCDAVKQVSTAEAMTPLAQQYIEKQKSDGEEDPAVAFMIATEAEGIAQRIREVMKLPKSGGPEPQLMLINIPDEGAFYLGPEGAVTPSAVAKFVADYEAKTLKKQQLKQG